MWKPVVAALGNFFFMGLGTVLFGLIGADEAPVIESIDLVPP